MDNKKLFALTAVGLAAAIAVPTIAFGNARRDDPASSLNFLKTAQTPLVARMDGPSDLTTSGTITPTGDADGAGSAAFTFDIVNPADAVAGAQVCFDLAYSNLTGTPTAAHIHRGAAGVGGPVVVIPPTLPNLTATGGTGCVDIAPALATEIVTTPANFYINIHTSDFPAGAIRGQLAAGPPPAGEAHLLATPLRAYDSRDAAGPKILAGETRTISLATGHTLAAPTVRIIAVPPGATAAIVTLTVTETATGVGGNGGFLTMYNAALTTQPATSSINWAGVDQNIAVSTQVAVDASGSVKVAAGANATHFVIDVIGYLY